MKYKAVFLMVLILGIAGCNTGNDSRNGSGTGSTQSNWYQPGPYTTWQWQLTGTVNESYAVEVYDIDLFESPKSLIESLQASGKKVICYFSAGTYEDWRPDKNEFNATDIGNPVDGWPGENWLDIRSTNVRKIMRERLDLAQQKGCDGVEPDNVDGYANNTGFSLSAQDQLDYNRFIAREAHSRNLSVGLKNDLDQVGTLVSDFDFAINEQCFQYDECDALTPFIKAGKAVFNAEYAQIYVDDANARSAMCTDSINRQFSTLVLPVALDDSFRYSCL